MYPPFRSGAEGLSAGGRYISVACLHNEGLQASDAGTFVARTETGPRDCIVFRYVISVGYRRRLVKWSPKVVAETLAGGFAVMCNCVPTGKRLSETPSGYSR